MSVYNDKIRVLLQAASEMIGAGSGAAIATSTVLAGPAGAAAASVGGILLSKALNEVAKLITGKALAERETKRIGATLGFAINEIERRYTNGEQPRNDDFFNSHDPIRSKAESILEGVLLSSKDDYDEKKLKFLGNLYASIAFSSISYPSANQWIKLLDSLTYRQLCCLALYRTDIASHNLSIKEVEDVNELTLEKQSILQEIFELNKLGFINGKNGPSDLYFIAFIDITAIKPGYLELTNFGRSFADYTGLDEVPKEDIEILTSHLQ